MVFLVLRAQLLLVLRFMGLDLLWVIKHQLLGARQIFGSLLILMAFTWCVEVISVIVHNTEINRSYFNRLPLFA
jgi:hypothetical protein